MMIIEATLAPPERARAGATGLALLVNGRPVRDRVLARAVANSYGSILDGGRYPMGVVWIDLPPELVDVNVHPQKAEVRFTDARGVFDAITRELHRSLGKAFGLPELGASPFARARLTPPTLKALQDSALAARNAVTAPAPPGQATLEPPTTLPRDAAIPPALPLPLPETNLFAPRGVYGSLHYIGQVRGTFLLCEGEDGLYVLDQHAAAERVTFDRLRRAYAAQSVKTQRLLVPELVELAESDVSLFDERAEDIARLGLELRPVGAGALAVHGVPAILRRAEPSRLVRDLASELSREGGRAFRGAVDLVLATMACHGSLRAGDAVAPAEAQALLAALDDVDFAGHCPHGRPIVTRMAWGDLERRVGR
jgi:DNA mismatch repair protein MutL